MEHKGQVVTVGQTEPGDGVNVSAAEVQEQLNRILHSAQFQRSERLQGFLRFVCECTLRGESHHLHEYLIGSEVFGRGADYSPNEDGIVRRQAHALRRKLQEYYEKEGADDPIRIELPIGRYVPQFRRSTARSGAGGERKVIADAEPLENQPPPIPSVSPAPQSPPPSLPVYWLVGTVAVGILLFVAGWVLASARSPKQENATAMPAELRELWGPWLGLKDGVVVCFSNPLTAVLKHLDSPLSPSSLPPRILLTPEQQKLYRHTVPIPPGGYLYMAPAVSQTKMGEAFAAVSLASFFTQAGVPLRATQSRFVTWEDLTRENMIMLGHNEANPWLDRILGEYPIQLTATRSDKQRAIVNSQAPPGSAPEYHIKYGGKAIVSTEEYALISMLPGVNGRRRLLLINGLNTQATQIAAEYMISLESTRELLKELRKKSPTHTGEWYFQAVIKTEVRDHVPTRAALVELLVLKK